jgi:spore coat protein CotF
MQQTVRAITWETSIEEYMNLSGYLHRGNVVKDGNGDLLADSHNIMSRRKNYFSVTECA